MIVLSINAGWVGVVGKLTSVGPKGPHVLIQDVDCDLDDFKHVQLPSLNVDWRLYYFPAGLHPEE